VKYRQEDRQTTKLATLARSVIATDNRPSLRIAFAVINIVLVFFAIVVIFFLFIVRVIFFFISAPHRRVHPQVVIDKLFFC